MHIKPTKNLSSLHLILTYIDIDHAEVGFLHIAEPIGTNLNGW